jgi:cytochrome c oxidase subunit II
MVGLAACAPDAPGPTRPLSSAASVGRQLSIAKGCAACHGRDGEGGVGPAWTGLLGSTIQIQGGGTVLVDEAYVVESIIDPAASIVAGSSLSMPAATLSDAEIESLMQYIRELSVP